MFDNKGEFSNSHTYLRPEGAYFDHLKARKKAGETFDLDTRLIKRPRFAVFRQRADGSKVRVETKRKIDGTRTYGVHHPCNLDITDGAGCPAMGGDFGEDYYGAAFPTNYPEVTPLCDGIVVDIKFYANLDGARWNDETKNLANNTGSRNAFGPPVEEGGLIKNYTNDTEFTNDAMYGNFAAESADPYMVRKGLVNHEAFTATGFDELTFPSANPQVSCSGSDCPNSP